MIEKTPLASRDPRAWLYFAINSEILTDRQRQRILACIGYQ